MTVPVLVVGKSVVIGYNPTALKQAIDALS